MVKTQELSIKKQNRINKNISDLQINIIFSFKKTMIIYFNNVAEKQYLKIKKSTGFKFHVCIVHHLDSN